MKITIDIEDAAARAAIQALDEALSDTSALHAAMAKGVEGEVRDNLRENYIPRNSRGNFWERVERSIEVSSDEKEASILLTELGIRLRYDGGEVYPGKNPAASGPNKGSPTKALAVPSRNVPVRRGRQLTPAKAGLLAFLRAATRGDTVGYLVEGEARKVTRGPNKGKTRVRPKKGGNLMFTLRKITRHKGDKGILPAEARLIEVAEQAALDVVAE
ncbi:MAG: hypothetical protein AAGB14_00365 [Verrucomicrobiota bacterium]